MISLFGKSSIDAGLGWRLCESDVSQTIRAAASTLTRGPKFCLPSLKHSALCFAVEIMQHDERKGIQNWGKARKSPIARLFSLPLRPINEEEIDSRETIENKLRHRSVIPAARPDPISNWSI